MPAGAWPPKPPKATRSATPAAREAKPVAEEAAQGPKPAAPAAVEEVPAAAVEEVPAAPALQAAEGPRLPAAQTVWDQKPAAEEVARPVQWAGAPPPLAARVPPPLCHRGARLPAPSRSRPLRRHFFPSSIDRPMPHTTPATARAMRLGPCAGPVNIACSTGAMFGSCTAAHVGGCRRSAKAWTVMASPMQRRSSNRSALRMAAISGVGPLAPGVDCWAARRMDFWTAQLEQGHTWRWITSSNSTRNVRPTQGKWCEARCEVRLISGCPFPLAVRSWSSSTGSLMP